MVDKVEDGIFDLEEDELCLVDAPIATDKLIRVSEQLGEVQTRLNTALDPIAGKDIGKQELVTIDNFVSESLAKFAGKDPVPFIAVEAYRGLHERRRLIMGTKSRLEVIITAVDKEIQRRRTELNRGA
jgi:hypothetical protein